MELYVGLDVHSKQSAFVIEDADGNVVARGEVPTSREGMERLRTGHALAAGIAVALETGTTSFFVARELSTAQSLLPITVCEAGYRMAVIAVAHRLCWILYSMLKNRTNFDIAKVGVQRGPFQRTAQHLYRLKVVPIATRNT